MSKRQSNSIWPRIRIAVFVLLGVVTLAICGYRYSTHMEDKVQAQGERSIAYARIIKKSQAIKNTDKIQNDEFKLVIITQYGKCLKLIENGKDGYDYYETMADVMVDSYFIGAADGYAKYKENFNSL